ncbi:MAG: S41 family peptidase [Paludibacter sp.]|nr:S41 family peptidase [Paludibacter sp.]
MLLRKNLFLILVLFAVAVTAFAQDCDCDSNFTWVKQTFEQNDAGFQYIIDKKGQAAYDIHNQLIVERVKTAKDIYDCANILNEWLHFFRKGHIGIEILPEAIKNTEQENEEYQLFPDWETTDIDTLEFKKYLDNKKDFDFEGIWDGRTYKIGVKRIDNQYIGFIIDSKVKEWKTGQIKFRIYPDSVIYYLQNHSAKKFNHANLLSKNLLFFNYDAEFSFIRDYPKYEDKFSNSVIDFKPYFEILNKKTCYLRIPSFYEEFCKNIDSVIDSNRQKITKTENLIIDLRLNGGGSDICWRNIMPFIVTNPVRVKSCYLLSTELNNQHYKPYLSEELMNRLNSNLGKFVLMHGKEYPVADYGKIRKSPKQIAIIVDKYCASSTEQFLLSAKQSKKVKIFGTITAGALDFANLHSVKSPSNDFLLSYATSKDVDLENFPIDDIGIQPDFYLDNSIQEYQWVDYVNDILNGK